MTAPQARWSRRANCTLIARRPCVRACLDQGPGPAISLTCVDVVERVTRIELALSAWEADVLPLNYTREAARMPEDVSMVIGRLSIVPEAAG
jgi:hypothetical protein